ncbi:RING-type domain-containing protein [Citrus sinensis]|uniref:RING-type domain-containing protein n=1 Tax=Citrus sinensis TaxID=2711 RepID=A0ACB8MDM6_CITSI|nr:RING-type domain-containing protein [Citrus sinensis]
MAASKKFKNKSRCTHPFCQECIAKYIQVKVQDDNTAKIECTGLECKHDLDPFSCKPIIPSSVFSKWCDVLCEDYVLGFERSYCPNTNCMALVVNECERNGTLKKAQCPSCKQWFCFQCKLKWHAGYRCEESGNLRDPNDIMFGQLVETMNWTRCPGCGHCVERKNGCSVVMCRCKTQFCYKCGGKYPLGCLCFRSFACNCRIAFSILFMAAGFIFVLAFLIKKYVVRKFSYSFNVSTLIIIIFRFERGLKAFDQIGTFGAIFIFGATFGHSSLFMQEICQI